MGSVRPEEQRGIDLGAATGCLVCPLIRAFDKNLGEGQEASRTSSQPSTCSSRRSPRCEQVAASRT